MNVDALIDSIAKKAEPVRDLVDYEKDGLLYCGHCNTPKQCRIPIGGNVRLVGSARASASTASRASAPPVCLSSIAPRLPSNIGVNTCIRSVCLDENRI